MLTAHSKGRSLSFGKWAGKGRKIQKELLNETFGEKAPFSKTPGKAPFGKYQTNKKKLMLCFGIAPLLCALHSFGKWGERATINDNNLLGKPHSDGVAAQKFLQQYQWLCGRLRSPHHRRYLERVAPYVRASGRRE